VKRLSPLLILVALGLSACGEKKDVITAPPGSAQSVTLMLDWVPNADHVGIYQALAEGDFAKAAINLHVQVPSDPATPLQLVAAGKVDAAISYEPEVMLARNRGLPLVSVAALVQKPLTSLISLASKHIKGVPSLRGKTVGDAGIS
jgi:putative hydroxymethylpyrimidine transport system substrate-binding protein